MSLILLLSVKDLKMNLQYQHRSQVYFGTSNKSTWPIKYNYLIYSTFK